MKGKKLSIIAFNVLTLVIVLFVVFLLIKTFGNRSVENFDEGTTKVTLECETKRCENIDDEYNYQIDYLKKRMILYLDI